MPRPEPAFYGALFGASQLGGRPVHAAISAGTCGDKGRPSRDICLVWLREYAFTPARAIHCSASPPAGRRCSVEVSHHDLSANNVWKPYRPTSAVAVRAPHVYGETDAMHADSAWYGARSSLTKILGRTIQVPFSKEEIEFTEFQKVRQHCHIRPIPLTDTGDGTKRTTEPRGTRSTILGLADGLWHRSKAVTPNLESSVGANPRLTN